MAKYWIVYRKQSNAECGCIEPRNVIGSICVGENENAFDVLIKVFGDWKGLSIRPMAISDPYEAYLAGKEDVIRDRRQYREDYVDEIFERVAALEQRLGDLHNELKHVGKCGELDAAQIHDLYKRVLPGRSKALEACRMLLKGLEAAKEGYTDVLKNAGELAKEALEE